MKITLEIPAECRGLRLDQALSQLLPAYSRSRIQQWVRDGKILLSGRKVRPREELHGGEQVDVDIQDDLQQATTCEPQDIPIDVVFEDGELIVINKPAGLVVHPAAGNLDRTLQNALLYRFPELGALPRSGIVHRLDKDTSGLMVVARSLIAHTSLVLQLQSREMGREYEAIVNGVMVAGGTVKGLVGRHPVDRKRMAVVGNGKPAVTHYRVVEKFASHTHIRVKLETGRTHQIRVHMAHIKYPIVGDPVYGGRKKIPPNAPNKLVEVLRGFPRQALHAARLALVHPVTGESMAWDAAIPGDMQLLLDVLREAMNA